MPSPRYIFSRLLRRKDLCPGSQNCPEVLTTEPLAGPTALPCEGCPEQALTTFLASPGGMLINLVCDLDFALQAGVTIKRSEISYPEFLVLRQLVEERNKYEQEQIKNSQRKR